MAWQSIDYVAVGTPMASAWAGQVAADINETAVAKAQAAGDVFAATGANAVVAVPRPVAANQWLAQGASAPVWGSYVPPSPLSEALLATGVTNADGVITSLNINQGYSALRLRAFLRAESNGSTSTEQLGFTVNDTGGRGVNVLSTSVVSFAQSAAAVATASGPAYLIILGAVPATYGSYGNPMAYLDMYMPRYADATPHVMTFTLTCVYDCSVVPSRAWYYTGMIFYNETRPITSLYLAAGARLTLATFPSRYALYGCY